MKQEFISIPYNPDLVEIEGDVHSAADVEEPTEEISLAEREEQLNLQAEQDTDGQTEAVRDALSHARHVALEGPIGCADCTTVTCNTHFVR